MKIEYVLRTGLALGTAAMVTAGVAIAHEPSGSMMGGHAMHGQQGRMAHGGMMHDRRMKRGKGHGMMKRRAGDGMMHGRLFGTRVTPLLNLSVDDVRYYLEWRLKQIGNKRLKVGEVKAENGTIIADISTVDDSLVQRLKVDRRTGDIAYED